MLGFLPTRAYRPGTPGATTFLSPLSGTFNYGWDSFLTHRTYPLVLLERSQIFATASPRYMSRLKSRQVSVPNSFCTSATYLVRTIPPNAFCAST